MIKPCFRPLSGSSISYQMDGLIKSMSEKQFPSPFGGFYFLSSTDPGADMDKLMSFPSPFGVFYFLSKIS